MKTNTKSSITLPARELRLVNILQRRLGAKTKVEVVRKSLRLLKETTDREVLRRAFKEASQAGLEATRREIDELDGLVGDGLDR
jgi:hypothetical protein